MWENEFDIVHMLLYATVAHHPNNGTLLKYL